MPYQLVRFAYDHGIEIDYWDFVYPVEAIYFNAGHPRIALAKSLFKSRAHFRTVLLEELGHHFTSSGDRIIKANSSYKDILEIGQQEYRALAWAARYIMPAAELEKAFAQGLRYNWELAEHFIVDEQLVKLRIMLYFERERRGA